MWGGETRSATVEALEDTTAVALLAGDVRRLLAARPEIAVKLLGEVAAPPAGGQRADHAPVVPDGRRPGRLGARGAGRGPHPRGRRRARRRDLGHPGRPRPARRARRASRRRASSRRSSAPESSRPVVGRSPCMTPPRSETTSTDARARMVERQLRRRGIADERVLDGDGRRSRASCFVPPRGALARLPRRRPADRLGPDDLAAVDRRRDGAGARAARRRERARGGLRLRATRPRCCRCSAASSSRSSATSRSPTRPRRCCASWAATNVEVRAGDGTLGAPDRAPFDGISVTATAEGAAPPALLEQLAPGGSARLPDPARRRRAPGPGPRRAPRRSSRPSASSRWSATSEREAPARARVLRRRPRGAADARPRLHRRRAGEGRHACSPCPRATSSPARAGAETAVREVREETGVDGTAGREARRHPLLVHARRRARAEGRVVLPAAATARARCATTSARRSTAPSGSRSRRRRERLAYTGEQRNGPRRPVEARRQRLGSGACSS